MAVIDYIIIITLATGIISGVVRGFIRQAFSLGGIVAGVVLGSFLYNPFAGLLVKSVSMETGAARITAFILILIIVPVTCGVLGRLLSKLVKGVGLGFVNRILGAVSGTVIWLLLAGVTIHLIEMTGWSRNIAVSDSMFYAPVRDVSAQCLQWTWNKVQDIDLPKYDNDSKE